MYVQRELFPTWTDFFLLIWSSSDDIINDKLTEISYTYEQIIQIIINKIFYKKNILKHSFKIRQRDYAMLSSLHAKCTKKDPASAIHKMYMFGTDFKK